MLLGPDVLHLTPVRSQRTNRKQTNRRGRSLNDWFSFDATTSATRKSSVGIRQHCGPWGALPRGGFCPSRSSPLIYLIGHAAFDMGGFRWPIKRLLQANPAVACRGGVFFFGTGSPADELHVAG